MAILKSEAEIRQLISNRLPAVETAGYLLSQVQGMTGESWRIESQGLQLLARRQTRDKHHLGISRQREGRVLKRSGQGIGPQVLLQLPGWLIVEWLNGDRVTGSSFAALNEQGSLAALITQLHQQPLSGYPINLQRQLEHYWQQVDRRRMTSGWLHWHQFFMQKTPPKPLISALLHMDIHPGNLLMQGERLRLIDWEYAADGDIALELAALFRANQYTVVAQQHFLRHYVRSAYADLPRLVAQIQRWLPWVDYLMLMWSEVRWQQSGDQVFLYSAAPLYQHFCLSSSPCSQ